MKMISWARLREIIQAVTIGETRWIEPPKNPNLTLTPEDALRFCECITVFGSTEADYLAFKRALIRAGCPHIRIAVQRSQGLIAATIPMPQDRERLDLCIKKAGLVPCDMKGGA